MKTLFYIFILALVGCSSSQTAKLPQQVEYHINIGHDGIITLNGVEVQSEKLSDHLHQPMVVITSEKNAPHNSTIEVMDACAKVGITKIKMNTTK